MLILFFDVLVCKMNFFLKFGNLRIGFVYNSCLSVLNVSCVLLFYFILLGCFFLVRFDNGIVMVEKFGMNFL